MQYFIDSATGNAWAFDDDVTVSAGVASSPSGSADVPKTLSPCTKAQADEAAAPKPLTGDALMQANTSQRDALLSTAALAIGPLQDASDLGESTDAETASLRQWKQYRIAVNRIDLTQALPNWPVAPTV
jgi:hypothetical protein